MPINKNFIFNHPLEFSVLRRLADAAILIASASIASQLRFHASLDDLAPIHMVLLYLCTGLAYFMFQEAGIYDSWRGRYLPYMLGRLFTVWGTVVLIGLFLGFLLHSVGELSRMWLAIWYGTGLVLMSAYRIFIYFVLQRLRNQGRNSRRVVIVGYGKTGQELHRRALEQHEYGYNIIALQTDNAADINLARKIGKGKGKNKVSSIPAQITHMDELPQYASANNIDEIWITLPMSESGKLNELQYLLRNALIDVRWIPDTLGLQMLSNRIVDFMGLPTVDLNRPITRGVRGIIKHISDKLIAAAALIALSPVFLFIAVGIKLSSPGPIFFKQARLGLNGKQFKVYKFRSMGVHQEHGNVTQATKDDPRVTPFGQFLRRTSLDELPQFINVLIGDMSVVGPRPHALQHNEKYEQLLELYMARHRVKPGITGWAQIHGHRGETDTLDKMEKRVEFDLYYIQHWSLEMDMRILVWSAFNGWSSKNAY